MAEIWMGQIWIPKPQNLPEYLNICTHQTDEFDQGLYPRTGENPGFGGLSDRSTIKTACIGSVMDQ